MEVVAAQDLLSSPPFQTSETGFFRHLVSFVDSGNVLCRWKSARECPLRAAALTVPSPTRKRVDEELSDRAAEKMNQALANYLALPLPRDHREQTLPH